MNPAIGTTTLAWSQIDDFSFLLGYLTNGKPKISSAWEYESRLILNFGKSTPVELDPFRDSCFDFFSGDNFRHKFNTLAERDVAGVNGIAFNGVHYNAFSSDPVFRQ